jgi:tetratricopeptide (TPR) repeat protein
VPGQPFTDPRDPRVPFRAAVDAYLRGELDTARTSLERALTLAPHFTDASILLGDVLYRSSDITGAIAVYEAALRYAPSHQTLNQRLEAMRREATLGTGFFQAQGAHFTVLFEGPADEELARRAVEMLEDAYWRVGAAFGTYPEHLITVVLYTQEQFRDITRSPQWAAAAYDGRIRVPMRGALADQAELERVLTHEFTHALLQTLAPRNVPTWLHEGLAVAFEPNGSAWIDAELTRSTHRVTVATLTAGFGRLSSADARQAYVDSGFLARALVQQIGAPAVVELLRDLARGDRFAAAFETRAAMPFESFLDGLAFPR